jgi:uncharacterized membrane protein
MLMASVMIGMAGAPALAHKDQHKKEVAERQAAAPALAGPSNGVVAPPDAMDDDQPVDRSKMSTMARLLDWLGRLHPIIVHFPIAFFPAALFTAIVGRLRPAFAAPVRFLVITGGVIAPVAALLGWLDAGFNPATDDWLLQPHRWLGTGLGIGGLLIAWWSWKSPAANSSRAMVAVLTVVTVAIAIQGWFGGAMVHGMDHLNW